MGSFRVIFYNELVNSRGQVFRVCQRSVDVPSARTVDRAIAAAKRKFEREERVGFWGVRARSFEVERVKPTAPAAQAKRAGRAARGRGRAAPHG